ncbi:MAG: hypothetical protein DMG58_09755 [Acidobacteria bacterium]|nr:MAG: hypothetical protein DMG58_09755 [Acidobacteriota bacterium]
MVPVRRPAALSRMTIVSEPVQPVPIRVSQQEMAPRQMAQPKRAPVVAKSLPALRAELPASRPVATLRIRNRWPVIFFGAWLAGAALMLARLGWSFLHVRRLRRASVPLSAIYQNRLRQWLAAAGGLTRVELCGVEGITTPMSLGPIDPLIVMPTDFAGRLTESEFDQVLLHELAHVRRGDNWSKLVQRLIEALLFFHPAVWFTGRRLNLERESACDDWVVFMTGEVKPYAACLAKLAEATAPGRQPVLATGIFRGARQLTQRIERLLDRRRNTAPRVSRIAFVPALLLVAGAALVCSNVCAVLAGPVASRPFSHLQPVAFALQATTPDANEKQPTALPVLSQTLHDRLRDVQDQIEALQLPDPAPLSRLQEQIETLQLPDFEALSRLQEQIEKLHLPDSDAFSHLQEQLRALQSQDLDAATEGANQAREQVLQLQQNSMDQLLNGKTYLDLLAAQQALRDAQARSDDSYREARNGRMFSYEQSNGFWTGLNIRTKGQIEFTDDDSDVKSVSPGGSLIIEERRGWTTRKYEFTSGERRYSVNGQSRPIDDDARAWIGGILPQVIRDSAIGADARVKRILKQHGPNGVLEEISRISSDHAKRVYFANLFTNGALPPDALARAARQIGREISSDGEKARVLMDAQDLYLTDDVARVEYFDAINTIASDGEHRRVLSNVLQKDGRNKDTLRLALKSAVRISSDGEKSRLLMEAADAPAFDPSLSADFLHAVNTIASDGEHARVLMVLLRLSGLGKETFVMVMKSAGQISSDGEKSRVLMRATELYGSDPSMRTAFFNAAGTIASDGEHGRVLSAVLAKTGLDKETFIDVIRSAVRISSDGEKGRVLRQVAAICPSDDAIAAALVQAAESISSDGEYRRLMSAMLGRGDLAAKISKIKYI